jgi:SAM-dependent methyltransferase
MASEVAHAIGSCPVCNRLGTCVRRLPREYLKQSLCSFFGSLPPPDANLIDYSMWRCPQCTLEYAWPPRSGSPALYAWLAEQAGYYPAGRWEWDATLEAIASRRTDLRLLDVGCGAGAFLEKAGRLMPQMTAIGIDTSEQAIAASAARGATIHVATPKQLLKQHPDLEHSFDVVVAFHCLEHVSAPVAFIEALLDLLRSDGRLYISTPYSPMSLELEWIDPLNHPPHHMTRWNKVAYAALAARTGMQIRLQLPLAWSATRRALCSCTTSLLGRPLWTPLREHSIRAALHPLRFWRHLRRQRNRLTVDSQVAADVVLVEMRRADC